MPSFLLRNIEYLATAFWEMVVVIIANIYWVFSLHQTNCAFYIIFHWTLTITFWGIISNNDWHMSKLKFRDVVSDSQTLLSEWPGEFKETYPWPYAGLPN